MEIHLRIFSYAMVMSLILRAPFCSLSELNPAWPTHKPNTNFSLLLHHL